MASHRFSADINDPEFCRCGLHRDDADHRAPPGAGAIADPAGAAVELRKRIEALLGQVGNFAQCKGCLRGIYWVRHKGGTNTPYDMDGANHFSTCPSAERFAKKEAQGGLFS